MNRLVRAGILSFSCFLLTLMVMFGADPLLGQDATGRVVGNVYDQTGGVIAGVRIVVTNVATKTTRETVTDSNGYYQVLALPVGDYTISAEQKGFTSMVTRPNHLEINESLKMDLRLEIGKGTETIVVESSAHAIETINAALSSTVSDRVVQDMPLNGRNTLNLVLLQPGVLPGDNPGNSSGGGATDSHGATLGFSIGGGRTDSNTFILDGGLNNNLLSNSVVYNPNPDTVQEFKVLTSNFGAEYGRSAGGIVTVVTKSGTNAFHGTAFEFNRNSAYNANDFFSNLNGQPRPNLKRNQYGGTLGGPIFKNKLFFFFSYEGQKQKELQSSGPTPVFTTAQLNGDFSASPHVADVMAFLAANPFFQGNGPATIDPNKFDPVAKAYIAAGLVPSNASGTANFQNPALNNPYELTMKVDYELSGQDHLTTTLGRRRLTTLAPGPGLVPGFGSSGLTIQDFTNIAYTHILSPNMLNEFRATFQRNDRTQSVPANKAPTPSALGINVTPDNPTGPVQIDLPGLTIGFSGQGPTRLVDNTYTYSDVFSWTRGKHTMKFGATFSAYQDNQVFDFFVDGALTFSRFDANGNPGFGAGDAFANFLIGVPQNYFQAPAAPSNIRTKATYFFGQDEWHVKNNLTLTLGLRYEYSTPKSDTKGRLFNVIPGVQSTVFVNAPVGLVFPGDKASPGSSNFPARDNFAPRFGFAWQPFKDGKTSIRGGAGIFYDILKAEDNFQFNGQFPFAATANLFYFQSNLPATATSNYTFFSDPFGSIGAPNPFPSKPVDHNISFINNVGTFGGTGVFFVDPHLRTPYTYQYNLSIEHEIARNTTVQVAYVGSLSRKLTGLEDINPFDPKTLSNLNPQRVLNETPGNFPAFTNVTDNTLPPGFNPNLPSGSFGFMPEFTNSPRANYNALNVSMTRRATDTRFIGTTYFTIAYSYAHEIDSVSGFRQNNSQIPTFAPQIFRSSGDFDVRQYLTFSGGWDLPFNKGPQKLVKGWSIYPILSYRTGFPFTVLGPLFTTNTNPGPAGDGDAGLALADILQPIQYSNPRNQQTVNEGGQNVTGNFLFNPNAFSQNTPTAPFGTSARNQFRLPGRTNLDLSLAKVTSFWGERLSVEIRGDAFNILNHTQFQGVDNNPLDFGTTFGQITSTYDPRILQVAAHIRF
jgi:outer membrane receptor protein involved in Fe transport